MTSFTDEVMAIADVYAASLLQLAKEKGEQDEVAAEFRDLIDYLKEHPDFDTFMTSATIDDDPRRDTLEKIFRGRMNDLLLNLLQVLNNRRRLDLVHAVYRAVELRIEEEHHQQEVMVETAAPLPDDLRARLKEALTQRMGKEALLIETVRPELIGGVVLHVKDKRLDASLVTKLRLVRQRLTHRTTVEIHKSEGQYMIEG
jgi:ATP synthase F1 delta subunit